ncbi:Late embryogenesis abundant protein At5g17165 [Linum grandiflorum]
MAANCNRGIATVGKRVIGHRISNSSLAISPAPCWSGLVHTSAYQKNIEAGASGEDDGMIFQQPTQQLKSPDQEDAKYHRYWEPHPQTGVFGPASAASASSGAKSTTTTTTTTTITDAPEEQAWFRPTSLEDLEKPHPLP